MYRQIFTIRGEPFGESLHPEHLGRKDLVSGPPWSKAWFCPICGEVWATVKVEGSKFHIITLLCDRHPKTYGWMTELPGSLWVDFDRDFQDSLPEKVLEREVSLVFQAYEKGILAGGIVS